MCYAKSLDLQIQNIDFRTCSVAISPIDAYKCLNSIKYQRLERMFRNTYYDKKLTLDEAVDLLDLVSIDINTEIDLKLKRCIVQMNAAVDLSKTTAKSMDESSFDSDLNKIEDYLVKYYNDGKRDLKIKFYIDLAIHPMGIKFPCTFAQRLINKLPVSLQSQCHQRLNDNAFVEPDYGGSCKFHIFNNVTLVEDRISLNVHLHNDDSSGDPTCLDFTILLPTF